MDRDKLAEKLLGLNAETLNKLERWLVLFETHLARAEEKTHEIDIKEITNFTKALAEIIKLEEGIEDYLGGGPANDESERVVDPENLRRLLSEED
ncbi:hypothetical protein IT570_00190 [Candidatus Sumerlaeota bacterium]|nr:hypothetical protein [Candidatus Sumerlaeota bacterium]